MALVGADPATVRQALAEDAALPGTTGFAGSLDGRLLRDVLGRQPLFSEADDPTAWSIDPSTLDDPDPVPAGHARTRDGDRRLWTLPDPAPTRDRRRAVTTVRQTLGRTLDRVGTDGLAVAFSGGVDSALLAATLDAPLYAVGFPDSHDLAAARSAAAALGREADLRTLELDHGTLADAVPRVVAATGRTNPMDVGIALPLVLAAERAAADGHDRLALGQGADELFGGYAKIEHADDRVDADTVRGARREVLTSLPGELERDLPALRDAGVEPVLPLVHGRIVRAALALPADLLVTDRGERKWALRLAAREWLPDPVAFREKKAVQYGSLVARELDRLARRAGFKRWMDDHVTRYVESLR